MARPKAVTDERLLAAAGTVIGRRGPGFTLAEVAAEAGVAVGTVAHRFGSKAGLLAALARDGTAVVLRRLRADALAAGSPREALPAALTGWFAVMADPGTAANHLAQLGADLVGAESRALLAGHFAAIEAEIRRLVRAAALPGAPAPARAARLLVALVSGTALDWAIRPRGRLAERVRQDVAAVLTGWE